MNTNTSLRLMLLCCAMCLGHNAIAAADGFSSVKCGTDIVKALVGKTLPNGNVSALEARHQAIALQDLGATEVSDRLDLISWKICGDEYMVLQDKHDQVRDVLPAPQHSKAKPSFIGTCTANGKALPGVVVAILDGTKQGDTLPVTVAWKIDEAHAKFVKTPEAGLTCPRSGIATVDGGL